MLTLCLLLFCLQGFTAGEDGPIVDTTLGKVQGQYSVTRGGRKIVEFLGIPYAKPPVKRLRFKSPESPEPWTGVLNATNEGDRCLQQFNIIEAIKDKIFGTEDCLYLNVFTPDVSPSAKFPVIVFVHGGAYSGLSNEKAKYGPELLLDKDVVLVNMRYRSGILGLLSTEDTVIPGNFGLKDQVLSFKWVRDNIANFGGDPNSITIQGESSGAASVHLHTLSPLSKGLFNRAIIESGSGFSPWSFAEKGELKSLAKRVAKLIGCPFSPSEAFLRCLQDTPGDKLVNTTHQLVVGDADPVVLYHPVAEKVSVPDAFLTKRPWRYTSTVPIMAGFNFAEGGIKTASLTTGDVKAKFSQWNANFYTLTPISLLYANRAPNPDAVTKAIRDFYFGPNVAEITPEMLTPITQMYSDAWFTNGVMDIIERHKGPKFLYYFAYNSSFSAGSMLWNSPLNLGANHLDEMRFCYPFDNLYPKVDPNNPDYKLSLTMVELWTNFAKNSVPTAKGVTWNPVKSRDMEYLEITNSGITMKSKPIHERRQFWKTLNVRRADEDDLSEES